MIPIPTGQPVARSHMTGRGLPLYKKMGVNKVNCRVGMYEMVGMALCALLSLAAFLPLLAYGDRLPAVLALFISLACPAVWLLFLLWSSGGGGGLVQRARNLEARLCLTPRLKGRSAGIAVEG